jgi:hypothetical protein
MPGNLPTELQSNTKDWFSSNDKDLRDAIKSVVSRYGFALNTLALDTTSSGTLDLRYNVFLGNTTVGAINMSLSTATTWGDRKAPFITIINAAGTNNIIISAATGDTIVGYTSAATLTILPGECWELFPDYRGLFWYAFRKQTQVYKEGTWTPTVTSSAGTFTTVTGGTGKYTQNGRTVFVRLQILITTNGTAAGNIQFTLPFRPIEDTPFAAFETDVTGFAGTGYFQNAGNKGVLVKYDGTYLGGNSYRIDIAGTYHIS